MNTEVNVAYRRGDSSYATAQALDQLPFLDDEHAVLKVEVTYYLGHLDEAAQTRDSSPQVDLDSDLSSMATAVCPRIRKVGPRRIGRIDPTK